MLVALNTYIPDPVVERLAESIFQDCAASSSLLLVGSYQYRDLPEDKKTIYRDRAERMIRDLNRAGFVVKEKP